MASRARRRGLASNDPIDLATEPNSSYRSSRSSREDNRKSVRDRLRSGVEVISVDDDDNFLPANIGQVQPINNTENRSTLLLEARTRRASEKPVALSSPVLRQSVTRDISSVSYSGKCDRATEVQTGADVHDDSESPSSQSRTRHSTHARRRQSPRKSITSGVKPLGATTTNRPRFKSPRLRTSSPRRLTTPPRMDSAPPFISTANNQSQSRAPRQSSGDSQIGLRSPKPNTLTHPASTPVVNVANIVAPQGNQGLGSVKEKPTSRDNDEGDLSPVRLLARLPRAKSSRSASEHAIEKSSKTANRHSAQNDARPSRSMGTARKTAPSDRTAAPLRRSTVLNLENQVQTQLLQEDSGTSTLTAEPQESTEGGAQMSPGGADRLPHRTKAVSDSTMGIRFGEHASSARLEEYLLHQAHSSPKSIHRLQSGHTSQLALADAAPGIRTSPNNVPGSDVQASRWQLTAVPLRIPVIDLAESRMAVAGCLEQHLSCRRKCQADSTSHILWFQRTCPERMARARSLRSPGRYVQTASPFADMSKQQMSANLVNKQRRKIVTVNTFAKNNSKERPARSVWDMPPVPVDRSTFVDVPSFKEHIALKDNILVDNVSKLTFTPYHSKDLDESAEAEAEVKSYREKMCSIFDLERENNSNLDLRREQTRFYKRVVQDFLGEIGLGWEDVLYWLLAPERKICEINRQKANSEDFKELLLERSIHQQEGFSRSDETRMAILFDTDDVKWYEFLGPREEIECTNLRLAALACNAFLEAAGFSIWHILLRSKEMRKLSSKRTRSHATSNHCSFRHAACSICHGHNCMVHGEIRQQPVRTDISDNHSTDSSSEDSTVIPAHQIGKRDVVREDERGPPNEVEKIINYKIRVNATESPERDRSGGSRKKGKIPTSHAEKKWERSDPFVPCNHEGSCDEAQCRCFRDKITCEKYCKCDSSCSRRFSGCRCAVEIGACQEHTCVCRKNSRECDADLCITCGATEILDPVNRYNEVLQTGYCTNVAIQRGVPRRTYQSLSEIHGFGLFIGEDLAENDFIGEYVGEIVSEGEADRRTIIYEGSKSMYQFELNQRQGVDATYMGNKTRFINNASGDGENVFAKVKFCHGVFRIGLFAKTSVKTGSELFFNYHYGPEVTAGFKQPKQVAVKSAQSWAAQAGGSQSKGSSLALSSLKGNRKTTTGSLSNRPSRLREPIGDDSQSIDNVPEPPRIIQETDSEDNDLLLDGTQETEDQAEERVVEDSEEDVAQPRRGRYRSGLSSVVAVKQTRVTARPVSRRSKRKRQSSLNGDD